jgi:nitrite reductase (NADH) small subunit
MFAQHIHSARAENRKLGAALSNKKIWVAATHCNNIPLLEGRSVAFGRRRIAVFNLGDRFLAIDDSRPYTGGSLSEGVVSGTTLACSANGWKVDLETGSIIGLDPAAPLFVETFRTRVEGGLILLELPQMFGDTVRDAPLAKSATASSGGSLPAVNF